MKTKKIRRKPHRWPTNCCWCEQPAAFRFDWNGKQAACHEHAPEIGKAADRLGLDVRMVPIPLKE